MTDSLNNSSDSNSQGTDKSQECCSGGSCSSPMQCCDWKSIGERVKAVLTDPKNVWPTIKAENKSIKEMYMTYLIPLSVIGVLCGLLGNILFGGGSGFFGSIVTSIVQLALGLGLVYVNAMIYSKLASFFDGNADLASTFKLLMYGSTASLIGAFLAIFPPLSLLAILFSIYTLYTIYQGIPVMTGVTSKRVPYFISCIVVSIVVSMIIGAVVVGVLGVGAVATGGARVL